MTTEQAWAKLGVGLCLLCLPMLSGNVARACEPPTMIKEATPKEIRDFFKGKQLTVLTFAGYSGAEYEDKAAMLKRATEILDQFDPKTTIFNIGATPEGIGAVYKVAKQKGFVTTGIVSSQAKASKATLSPCVDFVFFVGDATWGGFVEGSQRLSPTSTAMVENSDVMVAIGGGEVARDELIAAKRLERDVRFFPADMNHALARAKAMKEGQAAPMDFRGAAGVMFRTPDGVQR